MRSERTIFVARATSPCRQSGARAGSPCYMIIAAVLIIAGCQSTHLAKPLDPKLAGNDATDQLEFWHALTDEPVASNDQAFHGMLLYLDGKDDASNYAERVQSMKSRRLLPSSNNSWHKTRLSRRN